MDYPTRCGGSIYDLLSGNNQGKGAYIDRKGKRGVAPPTLHTAIRSAADEFYVIDRGRKDIIVLYENSKELVERYAAANNVLEKRKILQKLGKFSVSVYKYQEDALEKSGALTVTEDGLTVLSPGFYNEEYGVDLEGNHEFLYV
jgi:CRISPR-associated endonuclease/helicase Cas3